MRNAFIAIVAIILLSYFAFQRMQDHWAYDDLSMHGFVSEILDTGDYTHLSLTHRTWFSSAGRVDVICTKEGAVHVYATGRVPVNEYWQSDWEEGGGSNRFRYRFAVVHLLDAMATVETEKPYVRLLSDAISDENFMDAPNSKNAMWRLTGFHVLEMIISTQFSTDARSRLLEFARECAG